MQTELARLEGNRVELKIEVPADEVERAFARAYANVAAKVRIPGFRKGKAPRALIQRFVGQGAVMEEAFEQLFPKAYFEALKETGVEPIEQPEVSDLALEEGKPCTFKVQVEVMPEVKLGQYRGLSAVKAVTPVTDIDVASVLENLRERQAELVESEKEKLEPGLFAVIDFDGFIDGAPFSGGAGRDVQIEIGGGRFLPGFEEGLVGAAKGEEREVTVPFPENYHARHLAGKEAVFKIKVKEIKEKKVPELDDEFAKDVSDFATLEELKEDIRRRIGEERDKAAQEAVENQLIAAAAENASVEVPEKLVERRVERKFAEFVQRLEEGGYTLADYLGEERTEEDLRNDLKEAAREEVKTRLVVEAIVKAEGITVSDDEVQARLVALAGGNEEQGKSLKDRLEKEGRYLDFVDRMASERAVNLLVETADIKEEVTPTEPEKDKKAKTRRSPRKKAGAADAKEDEA
ncbi:MAG: trigger factor [Chitinophagales bacterium]